MSDQRPGRRRRLTADDVRHKRFTPVRLRQGYDMDEVDLFLDDVEAELTRLGAEVGRSCPTCRPAEQT